MHQGKYEYIGIVRRTKSNGKSIERLIKYRCGIHGVTLQRVGDHLRGEGCSGCANQVAGAKRSLSQDEYISKAKAVHGNTYDYSLVRYRHNKDKITIICPKHGPFQQEAAWHVNGHGKCPKCKASVAEQRIMKYLDDHNIQYEREYHIGKSNARYDFYIPGYNLLIEYDGIQHFKPNNRFGGIKALKHIRKRDRYKNHLAKIKGYHLIRFNYKQFKDIEKVVDDYFTARAPLVSDN